MCDGPATVTRSILRWVGWHCQAPDLFAREGRLPLGLLDGPESWWPHEIRQAMRHAEWSRAHNTRGDMSGIESTAGLDKMATIRALNSTKIPPEQKNNVRELLGDRVWTADSPDVEVAEDEDRMLWRCPQWETLRREEQAASSQDRLAWSPCTTRCGILLEDPEAVAWADAGISAQPLFICGKTLPENVLADARFEGETQNDDSVMAWTDGTCVCNHDARFRGAGCGVFFSIGDDRNRSFTLTGREETNNRAKLLAAIAAMRVQDGNLEIKSDSESVVRIAAGLLQGERQLNNESNADLWDEFLTELRLKTTRQLDFVWIKGHATKFHIDREITTTLGAKESCSIHSYVCCRTAFTTT